MTMKRETVQHIAELAKLDLTDDEITQMSEQLSDILSFAEQLQELDTDDIPPTASVLPLHNVLRPDQARPSLPHEVALREGPDTADGQFRVDAVWE